MTANGTTRLLRSNALALLAGLFFLASPYPACAQASRPPRPAFRPYIAQRSAPQQAQNETPRPPVPRPQSQQQNRPQPPVRPDQAPASRGLVSPNRPGQTQQHLAGWMESHSNLPLAQQQRALENEPGFHNLPSDEQQRLHNRLTQLNSMPPEQRQRVLQHSEAMEKLPPAQRQQVRTAMGQLGNLPEDRRAAVSRAFHAAVRMPEPQRQAWMNSPQFRGQFSDQERDTLNHLLEVQPFAAQAGLPGFTPRVPTPQAPPY